MEFLLFGLTGLKYIVLADVILSWLQGPQDFPRSLTHQVTAPLYRPIHAILNPQQTGGMDLSPIVVFFAISIAQRALLGAVAG